MSGTPANENPACFHQADPEEATARLVRLIRRHRPHVLVSYNHFGGYGHPDHIKARQVTWSAFDRAGDPEFAPTPDLPPWQPLKLYEIAEVREMVQRWRDHELAERRRKAAEANQPDESANDLSPEDASKAEAHAKLFELMESHSTPLAEVTTSIETKAYRDTCRDALRCHRTQIPADSDFFQSQSGEPPELFDFEHFNRARSLIPVPDRENDLFAGLR
jgi:LmbE family N-acetylglucosaminyl deacetylase